ncbi:similar to Saccharomyces cerevisiae YOR163W DDP1 Polyphosphate phosphatase [Geotrichum candidum]|nr:similar to Saccharomyces cerevisiae YOR163W DDP1 Polyphosphate phosphatase [Geotrichum candidum]
MVARIGREKQLYTPSGARVVAGTVILNADKTKVLMVSSQARKDRWIIPKGGVEVDEANDYKQAALRETWEEAGAIGTITHYLGPVAGTCPTQFWDGPKTAKRENEFHFYELELEKLEDVWPEGKERKRKWADYQEAREELLKHNRIELAVALEKSSLKR